MTIQTSVKDYRRDFGGDVTVADDEYHKADDYQTPPYALAVLNEFMLSEFRIAWEPAKGDGVLAQALKDSNFFHAVIETGIEEDFFEHEPPHYDVQITNPPWSKKYKWLERSLKELHKPFALLLPSKIIFSAKAINMIENNNIEIIQVWPRIGYKSVNMNSFLQSRPQLDSCWLTWGFRIGRRLTYAYIGEAKKKFLHDLRAEEQGQIALF